MKRSQWMIALAILLCVASLLSGTLLVLHADHICTGSACMICPILARCMEWFMSVPVVLGTAGLLSGLGSGRRCRSPENRCVPEWTLVQRKVKLLN